MPEGFTIKHIDEFETLEGSGGATWKLARKSLEIYAFGMNVVEIEPGGQIPEHDHADEGDIEVYAILEGEGTFLADGEEIPAPPGTFVHWSPATKRSIRNSSGAPVRALLVSTPPETGYRPMSWG